MTYLMTAHIYVIFVGSQLKRLSGGDVSSLVKVLSTREVDFEIQYLTLQKNCVHVLLIVLFCCHFSFHVPIRLVLLLSYFNDRRVY